MIRVFRNIRKQLAGENKPAKYLRYAIGEIVLVVLGILIALQINNWNEERKDHIQEVKILKEIKRDLIETKEEVVADLRAHSSILGKSQKLLNHLMNKIPENDSIATLMFSVGSDLQVYPKTSGFEALKSNGIHLITSDSLRTEITNFYQLSMKRLVEIGAKESPELNLKNEIDPFIIKYLVPNDNPKEMRLLQTKGDSIYVPFAVVVNYDEMLNDMKFRGAIVRSIYKRVNKIESHEFYVERIGRVIGHIQMELRSK